MLHQEEERKEKLRELLAEWRKHDNLTKEQVAERMGGTPPVISRLENNITKASIDTRGLKSNGTKTYVSEVTV